MTEQEKREQKAMLLLEHQEARDNLAHLNERAYRMGESIYGVVVWLGYGGMSQKRRTEIDQNLRANPHHVEAALNAAEVLSVMNDIRQAEEKLEELTRRKMALGLE